MSQNNINPLSRVTYIIDPSGCHLCISHATNRDGYPIIKIKGRSMLISRYIWEELRGPIPPGMVIRHTCDNPACINLDHLILGTQMDNVLDRVTRGRSAIGSRHGRAKIDELDVRIILTSSLTNSQLAGIFGIDRKAIYDIRHCNTWKAMCQTEALYLPGKRLSTLLQEVFLKNALPQLPLRWIDLMAIEQGDTEAWKSLMMNHPPSLRASAG